MKPLYLLYIAVFLATATDAQQPRQLHCDLPVPLNKSYRKAHVIDSIMQHSVAQGVPGISIAIYNEKQGWWYSAAGYANLKTKEPMQSCHLQYLQSVAKTYMAVTILQLKEQGKINIDAPMNQYLLPKYQLHYEDNSITVRHLLTHTSGIPDYATDPGFASRVLQQPLKTFTREEALSFIKGQPLLFTPGSKFEYCNGNYLLLSLIADAITGDHTAYIRQHIFKPLGIQHTYYSNKTSGYIPVAATTHSYWDVFDNGRVVDISAMQQVNVSCLKGDDGIVATPSDVVLFMKGLMEGKLLSPASLALMQTWTTDASGNLQHGMGLFYFKFGDTIAYGHGGGGLGAGCALLYFPKQKTYVFFAVNLGVVLAETKLVSKVGELRDGIVQTICVIAD